VAEHIEALRSAAPFTGKEEIPRELRDLRRKTHQTIRKVTEDIRERFHFNTAIAAVMELVNHLYQVLDAKPAAPALWPVIREATEALVLLIAPMVPHIAEELWEALGHTGSIVKASWPSWDEEAARAQQITLVVQVNGKLRSRIDVSADAGEEQLRREALADARVQSFLAGKPVRKVVVVPKKLVNIVV
jgi:leucyl-tRNA synthetase